MLLARTAGHRRAPTLAIRLDRSWVSDTSIRLNDRHQADDPPGSRRAAALQGDGSGRRPVVLVDVNTVVSTLRALRAAVIATASGVPRRRIFADRCGDCDPRRSCAAGAAAHRNPAARLGEVGRSVVPAGVPRGTRRRHGIPVPAHGVHAGRGPAVRPGPRCPAGGRWPPPSAPSSPCCWSAPPGGNSTDWCAIPASTRWTPGCANVAGSRLVDAADPRRAVLGAELRGGRVGGASAALHAGHPGRTAARARRRW